MSLDAVSRKCDEVRDLKHEWLYEGTVQNESLSV